MWNGINVVVLSLQHHHNRRFLFAVTLQSQLIIIADPGMLDRCTSKVNVIPQTLFLPTDDVIMKKWRQEMGLAL